MDWFQQFRALLGLQGGLAPAYGSNDGGSVIQRGISVITAPFTPPVLDPGQAAYYNGQWFQAAPAPQQVNPVTLDPGQSVFSGGQLYTAPGAATNGLSDALSGLSAQIQAALASLVAPAAAAPAAPAPVATTPSAPAAPSCNSGNYSCIRYACAPGNYSCARGVAPWYTGGNIW